MSSTEKNNITSRPLPAETSIVFLSDVHLGAFSDVKNKELEQELIRLIDFCEIYQLKMIILGDFFDYWMEYAEHPPPIGEAVLSRFKQFHSNTGSHTLFITGNHDNWTGTHLEQAGFDLEHEYRIIRVNGTAFMVMHGDGLGDPDMNFPRPFLHRILRNPYFVKIYKALLPPRLGWQLMRIFSGSSKKAENKARSRARQKALDDWTRKRVLQDESIQAIIYGHHHRPVLWQKRDKLCMNCGFFGRDRTVGLYINKRFQIVIWDADKKALSELQISQSV